MQTFLRYGVIATFLFSIISLVFLIVKTFSFGKRLYHSETRQSGRKGVFYAFTRGMVPWEKESAGKHLLTYVAGIFYHAGVFAAFFYILSLIVPFGLGHYPMYFLQLLVGIGIICGLGLLGKRMSLKYMKALSCWDDYAANILVDLVLTLALVNIFFQSGRSVLFIMTIILFLYIPLGKIRHCFFFFYSRILFGIFFGRRGVLPQKASSRF